MSKIYDLPLRYFIPKLCVNYGFKRFFRPYVVLGEENIPKDAPFIFAANHLNALMDALAMLSVMPWRHSIVFLARADMFRNKTAAFWLRYVKIMPAFRLRDGRENMVNNHDTFDQAVEVLLSGNSIGILPEGNQGTERRMRPLQKGVCRIAFSAQEKYGQEKKVKIVPVGLDYGDFIKYGKHLIINIGKPIEIADYMAEYAENEPLAINQVKDELAKRLHEQTVDLATAEHYQAFEQAAYTLDTYECQKKKYFPSAKNRFFARQTIADKLCKIESEHPERIAQLETLTQQIDENLKAVNLKTWVLKHKPVSVLKLIGQFLALVVTLPIFLAGLLCNCLPFFTPTLIRKHVLKANNPLFQSSLQFGFALVTYPIFYIIQMILVGIFVSWNPLVLLGSLVAFGLLARPAYLWYWVLRKWIASNRYSIMLRKKNTHVLQAKSAYEKLKSWYTL